MTKSFLKKAIDYQNYHPFGITARSAKATRWARGLSWRIFVDWAVRRLVDILLNIIDIMSMKFLNGLRDCAIPTRCGKCLSLTTVGLPRSMLTIALRALIQLDSESVAAVWKYPCIEEFVDTAWTTALPQQSQSDQRATTPSWRSRWHELSLYYISCLSQPRLVEILLFW
jgi:hypothetical protein